MQKDTPPLRDWLVTPETLAAIALTHEDLERLTPGADFAALCEEAPARLKPPAPQHLPTPGGGIASLAVGRRGRSGGSAAS